MARELGHRGGPLVGRTRAAGPRPAQLGSSLPAAPPRASAMGAAARAKSVGCASSPIASCSPLQLAAHGFRDSNWARRSALLS